jgi:hypothetical protein
MAVYTTFFLCKPADLQSGFPGWRLPPWAPSERGTELNPRVVIIEGSYEDYLERRLPQFVRNGPHWATKGLMVTELKPLLEIAGVPAPIRLSIYSPSLPSVVEHLPEEFLTKLPSLDQENVAQQWAAAMSTPEHTHSVSGRKLSDGWTQTQALAMLRPLIDLSKKASIGQQMYLLTEA